MERSRPRRSYMDHVKEKGDVASYQEVKGIAFERNNTSPKTVSLLRLNE